MYVLRTPLFPGPLTPYIPPLQRGSPAVLARADHRLRRENREAGQGVQGTRGVAVPDLPVEPVMVPGAEYARGKKPGTHQAKRRRTAREKRRVLSYRSDDDLSLVHVARKLTKPARGGRGLFCCF